MTFEPLKRGLPNPNEDDQEKNYISKTRKIDKSFNFNKTKVREIVSCDNCAAPMCIYFQKILAIKEGQPQLKLNNWIRGLTADIFVGTRCQLKDFL